jgi:hypothetical protein
MEMGRHHHSVPLMTVVACSARAVRRRLMLSIAVEASASTALRTQSARYRSKPARHQTTRTRE